MRCFFVLINHQKVLRRPSPSQGKTEQKQISLFWLTRVHPVSHFQHVEIKNNFKKFFEWFLFFQKEKKRKERSKQKKERAPKKEKQMERLCIGSVHLAMQVHQTPAASEDEAASSCLSVWFVCFFPRPLHLLQVFSIKRLSEYWLCLQAGNRNQTWSLNFTGTQGAGTPGNPHKLQSSCHVIMCHGPFPNLSQCV